MPPAPPAPATGPPPPLLSCAANLASRAEMPGSVAGTLPDITAVTTGPSHQPTLARVCR